MLRFQLLSCEDVLELTVDGSLDLARSRALLERALAAAAHRHDVLVDLRSVSDDSPLSFADVFQLVRMLQATPGGFRGRMALLGRDRPLFEKTQFFESSASEYGFQVRAFLDFEAAVRWLMRTTDLSDKSAI
ncbi:MAG: hypothetical protein ACK41D_06910 [Rubricoccaceae bacterium]